MDCSAIRDYLLSQSTLPFFVVVGDAHYAEVLQEIGLLLPAILYAHSYAKKDKPPNLGRLAADVQDARKDTLVLGVGEYLALMGAEIATQELLELRDIPLCWGKVVFLLRGLSELIYAFTSDPRFDASRYAVLGDPACDQISITCYPPGLRHGALDGFCNLLDALEQGGTQLSVATGISFPHSLFSTHALLSAYACLEHLAHGFSVPESCGTEEQWAGLYQKLLSYGDLEAAFASDPGDGWLEFIRYKRQPHLAPTEYERYVLEQTDRYEDYHKNLRNCILQLTPKDKRFDAYLQQRKLFIRDCSEAEMADFTCESREKYAVDRFFYLTDSSLHERQAIIEAICDIGVIPSRLDSYPALAQYLRPYHFNCEIADVLDGYFLQYRRQKVLNAVTPEFERQVLALAEPGRRIYNGLRTREEVLASIPQESSLLFWLDAMGVEYLSFIQAWCAENGLSIHTTITQAMLPTLTCVNRGFYDAWDENRRLQESELDETKHAGSNYNYTNSKLPVHLAHELDIIRRVLETAKVKLVNHACEAFVLTSDHGASRLAVLRQNEILHDADEKGEHSGRCCAFYDGSAPAHAVAERGYWVLADYSRFRGGRAAQVEVHGGATLEEVLVPVIRLALLETIDVKLMSETVTMALRKPPELELFCKTPNKRFSVVVAGQRYEARPVDDTHRRATLSDVKKAGQYTAEIYEGEDLLATLPFTVQKGLQENELF